MCFLIVSFISYPELLFLDGELYINFREYLTQLHKKRGIYHW